jgi:hypothetical protein
MITILTGSWFSTMVASSWELITKLPSPSTSTTSRSGRPTWAPMAAGRP